MTPLVSVLVVAYKHEQFIAQALESVLAQRVNFDYEIVVGDDCSPDRTGAIVLDYAHRYPDRVRAVVRDTNVGGRRNWLDLYQRCQGRYVAYFDGDDYWTSPEKLQRQVDLLESRPDLSMCFHAAVSIDQDTGERAPYAEFEPRDYSLRDLYDTNRIPTTAVVVRNGLMNPPPDCAWRAPVGDWVFHVVHASRGNIGYIPEEMSAYRRHGGGVSQARRENRAAHLVAQRTTCDLIADYLGDPAGRPFRVSGWRRSLDLAICYAGRGDARALDAMAEIWRRRSAASPASYAWAMKRLATSALGAPRKLWQGRRA